MGVSGDGRVGLGVLVKGSREWTEVRHMIIISMTGFHSVKKSYCF